MSMYEYVSYVYELYNGLENLLVQIRDDFDVFENKAVEITGCSEYAKDSKRKKKRKVCLTY